MYTLNVVCFQKWFCFDHVNRYSCLKEHVRDCKSILSAGWSVDSEHTAFNAERFQCVISDLLASSNLCLEIQGPFELHEDFEGGGGERERRKEKEIQSQSWFTGTRPIC